MNQFNNQQTEQIVQMQNGLAMLINDYNNGNYKKMALNLLEQGITNYLQMPQISVKDRTELFDYLNKMKNEELDYQENEQNLIPSVMDKVEKTSSKSKGIKEKD